MSNEAYSGLVHAHVDDPKVYIAVADVSKEVDRMCAQLKQLVSDCISPAPWTSGSTEVL
jgi:hypothetical protein